ncbi:hypothetical protein [Salibacterium sp. K-3]
MDVHLVLEEPAHHTNPPVYAYADEASMFYLKPDPVLDHHPTLGWMLKNRNETIAAGVNMTRNVFPPRA